MLALRKVSGVVRFWKGLVRGERWWRDNPFVLTAESMQYKKSGHIASKCNNVKACALPSSHLPLTREARTWCEARDSAKQTERSFKGKGVGDFRGIVRFFEESMSVQL